MKLAIASTLALILAVPALGDDLPASVTKGQELLLEGDKLADGKETTEAVLRYKLAFEQLLPGLRSLPFKSEVKRDVTNRDDLKAFLLKEVDEDQSPAQFKTGELELKVLGFIPREMNWKEVMVKVYSEEIAAFYDPKTKTMHLIKESEVAKPKKKGFLESLLGKKDGFDKDENKTVIAHELTHALADQHFDLDKMHAAAKDDDDRSMALSGLIEGEATLAMMGAQMEDWNGNKISMMPAADLDRTFTLMMPLMTMGSGQALREAPPILADSLLFPYLRGLVFCAKLTNDGGWKAIDEAYAQPPQSTEQILHPDKYLINPDPPTTVDLGKLEAGEGWTEVGRNVVGEFQLSILLKRYNGKSAASGWDGDRFAVFEGDGGKLGVVWATTWDTEVDAAEFARQYARFQTTKLGEGAASPEEFPEVIRRSVGEKVFAVDRHGKDVVVVEGFDKDTTDRLVGAAFQAKKTELAPIVKK